MEPTIVLWGIYMSVSGSERKKFIIINTLKNIKRQKVRYILIGIIILIISILTVSSFIVMVPAYRIVDKYKPIYTRYGAYLPDYELISIVADISKAETINSEQIWFLCNQIVFSATIIGGGLLIFVSMLLINVRMYDIGILYCIGFNKKSIFLSIFTEIAGFVIAAIAAGTIISSILIAILLNINIIPKYFTKYFEINGVFICLVLSITVLLVLLPTIILYYKIKKSSPLTIIRKSV